MRRDGESFVVELAAADVGTGARTALTHLAAETLGVPAERVRVMLGDTALPPAPLAGGSMGTASWGSAVVMACHALCDNGGHEATPTRPSRSRPTLTTPAMPLARSSPRCVSTWTRARCVFRLLGVFAAGRIVHPELARSQLFGGMTMGLGMALHEESVLDAPFGDWVNHDLAGYHVPVNADVERIDAFWLDEDDAHLNPFGAKGIGEIGIVGTAAAIANAVHHATVVRVRELPIRIDRLIDRL